jgi:diacylglycerol kinase family enzyme
VTRRVVLIVNPYSTEVTPGRLAAVTATLERRCELVCWETERRGHAVELAAAAVEEADALVVFAGDGTYNEAINGAAGRIPFGFVPGGGASVFPRALGLPRDPVRAATQVLDALERGSSTSITLGRLNGRRFCSSAGIGFDAEVVRRVDRRGRDRDGRRAGASFFLLTVGRTLLDTRLRIRPQLEVEGAGRACLVVVVNGSPYTYAGRVPVRLTTAADFGAGLDFVAPREVTPANVGLLAFGLFAGTLRDGRRALTGHDLDAFHVRCDHPLPAQADGEDLGDVTEAVFESERNALTVLR